MRKSLPHGIARCKIHKLYKQSPRSGNRNGGFMHIGVQALNGGYGRAEESQSLGAAGTSARAVALVLPEGVGRVPISAFPFCR